MMLGSIMPFLASDEPFQLRDHWTTDDRLQPMVNPLGLVTRAARTADPSAKTETDPSGLHRDPRRQFTGAARFRLLTLDSFDQMEWTSASPFIAVGAKNPVSGRTDGGSRFGRAANHTRFI